MTAAAAPAARASRGPRWRSPRLLIGAGLLAAVLLATFALPGLLHLDAYGQDLTDVLAGPSRAHPLGTDELGRDVLARTLCGGRFALLATLAATALATLVGLLLGLSAAFSRGPLDLLAGRLADVQLSLPVIVLAIVVLAFVGNRPLPLLAVLVAGSWVLTFRLVRAHAKSVLGRTYVDAARASGASRHQLAVQHVLPHIAPTLAVTVTLNASTLLALVSSLGYLGLGVHPPTPDWGSMVAAGQAMLSTSPLLTLAPGFLLVVTIVSLQLIGDGLVDRHARPRRLRPQTDPALRPAAEAQPT